MEMPMTRPLAVETEARESGHSEVLTWANYLNLGAYMANLVVTYISLTGIFGGTNADLSKKYQTLVTPAGWAFAIWGPIFIWEAVFAVSQMLPSLRGSPVVKSVAPGWALSCLFQVCWTVVFAQEQNIAAMICMVGILGSLVLACQSADWGSYPRNKLEFWLLRAPLSLHLGWLLCATAVSVNVVACSRLAGPGLTLGLAVASLAVLAAAVAMFSTAVRKPDAFPGFVAAWALAAINSELADAKNLKDPSRLNFYAWDAVTLDAIRIATAALSVLCLGFALLALGLCTVSRLERKPASLIPSHV